MINRRSGERNCWVENCFILVEVLAWKKIINATNVVGVNGRTKSKIVIGFVEERVEF